MIYLNGEPINITLFPDNTSQVWKLPKDVIDMDLANRIEWDFTHEGEFMQIAQLKDLLDTIIPDGSVHLLLNYLPYGRQDKEISNTSTFALRTFARLLNPLRFDYVVINDPHSSTALDLIDFSQAIYPVNKVQKILEITESTLVCYPDKGAAEKYPNKEEANYNFPYCYGEKIRDQLTGNIINYKLVGDPKDKSVLVVDDICDGGMTFKLLTGQLLKAGAKEVNLFVTHGIFSKGLRTLKDSGIKRIFTTKGEVGENKTGITYKEIE